MKFLISLSAALILASCSSPGLKEPSKKVGIQQGMDSPITVSDGSTYLRHPAFTIKNEQNSDDSNNYEIAIHVNDSGFMAYKIRCLTGCSAPNPTPLTGSWKVELWDNVNAPASGTKYGVIKPVSGPDVKVHFFNNPVQVVPDGTDPGQTDVVEGNNTLKAALLYNNGATSSPTPFVCSSSPCKIRINYCNDPGVPTCR